MARYAAPKSLGSIFNNEVYTFANGNSVMNNLSTNLSVTGIENVSQSVNIISEWGHVDTPRWTNKADFR